MDLETPADAWYTYVAVSLVSVALAGLALGVATGPPPDAPAAANAIEGATGSEYAASATYEHDADRVTIDRQTITMQNEHGTAHSSFSYGVVVPVNGNERLENITDGRSIEAEYDEALRDGDRHAFAEFTRDVETAYDEHTGEAIRADGELRARKVTVDSGIDELEPIEEEATVEVRDSWEPVANGIPGWNPDPYIGELRVTYSGSKERQATVHMEGEYRLADLLPAFVPDGPIPTSESLDETKELEANEHGADSFVFEPKSAEGIDVTFTAPVVDETYYIESRQPVRDPIEFEIEFTDPDGDLPAETWTFDLEYDDGSKTWSNEIDREMTFDHDHAAIGVTDGGNYYVTLVKV
ncbi:DUF7283 family protein [Halopiger aswanensis]|uniref:Uncharacterized protein n=1 Tax=Halopiger aswanensis TaxID=148449 RepID=A0A3R7DEW7_9EURY|nr:hypothetical protein [Halopiger aswanensis]RKD97463.1 hypothetical protein ATJ93_0449 [Halopiger aswanensis]